METPDQSGVLIGPDGLQQRVPQIGHVEFGALTKTLNQLHRMRNVHTLRLRLFVVTTFSGLGMLPCFVYLDSTRPTELPW